MRAIRVGPRSAAVLALASLAGLMMFLWPLLVRVEPQSMQHGPDAPFVFMGILPILIVIVLAELSEGGMDAKALAMLGVLSAVNAALRPLGAGTAGIETVFFMLVLAGRVFGPGFGFVLGCTSLFASALLTAGVGPWLPFQMMCSAWIGMGAGLLPRRVTGKAEIGMLVGYGIVAAYLFGFLMNLWFWPFITHAEVPYHDGHISYVPGAPMLENLHRFAIFTLLTSTAGWDTGRAITNTVAILVLGPAVLATLRRASRKASFGTVPTFGQNFLPGKVKGSP
ncbi:ECF transporter S component [Amycolatopsis sp. cg5]|uniref:ECF transporter S component n=1 Tax=Amycolatopsis sp. cg5 TaxID=3238802 RepID=UPI003524F088